MDYVTLFWESLDTLFLNKLRTGLAALGIVIGIGSVIALLSLGQATQQSIQSQIQGLGSNLLTISPSAQTNSGVRGASGGGTTLTYEDAKAIGNSSQVTTISQVSPEVARRVQVTTGGNNTNVQVIGSTAAYKDVHKVDIQTGSFIEDKDVESMAKVAVVGPQVVSDLFGDGANPIGQTIRINSQSFTIIGVTVSKGGTGFQNQDDLIWIPLTTAQKQIFGINYVTSIAMAAKNENQMVEAQDQVGYLLLARHKLSDPTQADFSILSQQDILNTATQATGIFTTLLSGIAAISLLVGGIGIMNIMLVTVTERIREIGLRKALGAKKSIITTQFLMESVILTIIGGGLGIILGIIISFIITKLTNLPFIISIQSVVLALGVSASIGILFGWYPARRAANLAPIEALRYE